MRLPRTSPWDFESVVYPSAERGALVRELRRRGAAMARRRPGYGRAVSRGRIAGMIGLTAVAIVFWRSLLRESFDGVVTSPALRWAVVLLAWGVLGVVAVQSVRHLVRTLREGGMPMAIQVRAAARLRVRAFRAGARRSGRTDDLDAEHLARSAEWQERLARFATPFDDFGWAAPHPMDAAAAAVASVLSLPAIAVILLVGGSWDTPWVRALVVPMVLVTLGWSVCVPVRHRLARARLRRSLRASCCPRCGYDLSGSAAAFRSAPLAAIGPRRCSECGSPWPLVPARGVDDRAGRRPAAGARGRS